MTCSIKLHGPQHIIASQWNTNARARLLELNEGIDKTYTQVLCPILYQLLKHTSEGTHVVDIGCGLGFLSDYLCQRGFDPVGVDISSGCISLARKTFPMLQFRKENILAFAHSGFEKFDAAVANMLFHNVPNIAEVAGAIFGLLQPHGVLVGCLPHPDHWFNRRRHAAKRISLAGQPAYLVPFKIKGAYPHPAPITYFHRQLDEYWRLLARVGFSQIQAISIDNMSLIPKDLIFFLAKRDSSPAPYWAPVIEITKLDVTK
jgi:SAM-dependent methyltransferase